MGHRENLRKRAYFGDLSVNGRILKWLFKKLFGKGGREWTGFIWLRIGTGGGLL
jgi:hypothetical protein